MANKRQFRELCWFAVASWVLHVVSAVRLEMFAATWENDLRLLVACAGTAMLFFAIVKPLLRGLILKLAAIGYLAYFVTYHAWGIWRIAEVAPTQGPLDALSRTISLFGRVVIRELETGSLSLAMAMAYVLVLMPLLQITVALFAWRPDSGRPSNSLMQPTGQERPAAD